MTSTMWIQYLKKICFTLIWSIHYHSVTTQMRIYIIKHRIDMPNLPNDKSFGNFCTSRVEYVWAKSLKLSYWNVKPEQTAFVHSFRTYGRISCYIQQFTWSIKQVFHFQPFWEQNQFSNSKISLLNHIDWKAEQKEALLQKINTACHISFLYFWVIIRAISQNAARFSLWKLLWCKEIKFWTFFQTF